MDTKSRSLRGRITWTVVLALALGLGAIATASAKDRNHDRIPDRWERSYDLSLKVNQAKRDQDHDSLVNRDEYRAGTNPREADTDNDGTEDADEGAGTITAWDPETGELTINLFGGDSVTGNGHGRDEDPVCRGGGIRGTGRGPRDQVTARRGDCTPGAADQ